MALLLSSFSDLTGIPDSVGFAFIFIFGAAVGSFLNVVIHRVPREESIVFPNSACPKCGKSIKPYDNIPILSWLLLRGKCRNCSEPISYRYPAVELLTGLLCLLTASQLGFTPLLPVAVVFVLAIVALMFIDAEHMILPNVITYPFFGFVIVVRLAFALFFGEAYFTDLLYYPAAALAGHPAWLTTIASALAGAVAGGGSLWLVGETWKRLRGVDAMGLGDVKMMLGVGALLGWRLSFLAIFIAAFAGAIIGIAVIAKQKDRDMQTQIPFGIFLGIGSIAAFLFGERMIGWYTDQFLY